MSSTTKHMKSRFSGLENANLTNTFFFVFYNRTVWLVALLNFLVSVSCFLILFPHFLSGFVGLVSWNSVCLADTKCSCFLILFPRFLSGFVSLVSWNSVCLADRKMLPNWVGFSFSNMISLLPSHQGWVNVVQVVCANMNFDSDRHVVI